MNESPAQIEAFRAGLLKCTRDFSESAARIAAGMLSVKFAPGQPSYLEQGLNDSNKIFISILFTGTIYGEYLFAIDEEVAARVLGNSTLGKNESELSLLRQEISDTFREFLNIVVGESIVGLGKVYDKLTLTAPRVYRGEIHYPKVRTGKATLLSDRGTMDCYLFIDRMQLDITASYRETVGSLTKAHEELKFVLKQLQDQQSILIQSEKMAALGTMAAGIAHEINTPLTTVSLLGDSTRELVKKTPIDRTTILKNLDTIEKTILRISRITSSMRALAHGIQGDAVNETSVSQIWDDALLFCDNVIGEQKIEIRKEGIPQNLAIQCHAPEISQVLLNLILNACDAIRLLPEKWISISAAAVNETIEISVSDSGPGIPAAIRDKIFDPFFTTKGVGMGKGLGLAASRGIIEAHGGKIQVDPIAKNTRFVITLPQRHVTGKSVRAA